MHGSNRQTCAPCAWQRPRAGAAEHRAGADTAPRTAVTGKAGVAKGDDPGDMVRGHGDAPTHQPCSKGRRARSGNSAHSLRCARAGRSPEVVKRLHGSGARVEQRTVYGGGADAGLIGAQQVQGATPCRSRSCRSAMPAGAWAQCRAPLRVASQVMSSRAIRSTTSSGAAPPPTSPNAGARLGFQAKPGVHQPDVAARSAIADFAGVQQNHARAARPTAPPRRR